jgi:hypothetical protein
MAKLSFSKLKLKPLEEVVEIDFNGNIIEVKKYLPINDKLEMVGNVLTNAADANRFWNSGKLDLFIALEIMYNYTNLTFTDKQKEDPCKLYDTIVTTGLYHMVLDAIGDVEFYFLDRLVKEMVESVYNYNNSIFGLLSSIVDDYSDTKLEASEIQKYLADPENLKLLKTVVDKLG